MITLIGNPNAGKTTIFNNLTNSSELTGNFSGVTVSSVPGIILSTNTIPFRWSISWHIACASSPFAVSVISFPSLFNAFIFTSSGLITFAYLFGKLKHPSSTSLSPFVSIISGLINTYIGSPSSYVSITTTLFKIPTCTAARPTPSCYWS